MNDDSDRTKVTGKALRVNNNSADERDASPFAGGAGAQAAEGRGQLSAGERQQRRGRRARPSPTTPARKE